MVVSPWTRGGYVYSEVSDHTSTIKLLEERFGIHCPNISPWRRAVAGNLLHAFDFENPDYTWPEFPSTEGDWNRTKYQCMNLPPPVIPTEQHMPVQEPGIRKSRALPYEFNVNWEPSNETDVEMTIVNTGAAGAAF